MTSGMRASAAPDAHDGLASTEAPLAVHAIRSDWPRHEADEIEAALDVLRSGRVNALVHGEENKSFACEFAHYVGVPHAICVANGTVSLELGLRALNIGPGDEVIVTARSFFASASCVLAVGATPVFADVQADSQNIDPASVERLISPRAKAVICVHLAGWPCDMEALVAICDRHKLFLIEDCAQAHGAASNGRRMGSFGDVASFSFCTDKIMSTGGEGGILLLKDDEQWARAWAYKDHGKNPYKLTAAGPPGEFRYLHDGPGSNFRLTEMQAAIGRCQLRKLSDWLDARERNAALLTQNLQGHPMLSLPRPPAHARHAWYKYYVQLVDTGGSVSRRRTRIVTRLQELGIPCGSGSCPDISRERAFAGRRIRRDGDLPVARALGECTLMFAVDHTLGDEDMQRTASALLKVLDE